MIPVLAVAFAQLADMSSYAAALRLGIGHEAWAAADNDPRTVIAGKAVIIAIIVGVWVFRRRYSAWLYHLLVSFLVVWAIVAGLFGAAMNVVNGGLL